MSEAKTRSAKQIERYFKGVANYRRIEILFLIERSWGISLEKIAEVLEYEIKNTFQHVQKLSYAGLVNKKHNGKMVEHTLSPYGKRFVGFVKTFININKG